MRRALLIAALSLTACGESNPEPIDAPTIGEAVAQVADLYFGLDDPAPLTVSEAMAEAVETFAAANAPDEIELEAEPEPEPVADATVDEQSLRLRHGESLALVAQWLGTTPEVLAERNELSLKARLDVGHTISYAATAAQQTALEAARAQFAEQRLARFLKKRGGLVDVIDHRVRRGQSLWRVARRNRLPMWVMAHYNQGRDLNALKPGDTIKLPVLGEGVTARR